MSDAPSLTLLHLSDLHFGQDRGEATARFNQQLVTQALLDDIRAQVKAGLKPDAVLVTGDIAFSGTPEEYIQAEGWLKQVCEATEITPSQLLLVPGNHDVDRKKVAEKKTALRTHQDLRQSPLELDYYLTEQDELQLTLWPKLAAYADFASRLGGPTLSPAQPFWRHRLEGPFGKPAVVLGLNSCLLSFDGNDAPTNLALGLGQLEPAFRNLPDDALVLVLAHHPPEWLVDGTPGGHCKPEHALTTFLQKHPHVLFVGHVHQQGGLVAHPLTSGGLLRFVAGAGHEAAQEGGRHAYAWLRLHAEGIDFYPRMWNADHQHFQPEANRFALEKGEEYIRLKRTKLPDKLEKWLEPALVSPGPTHRPLPHPFIPPAWKTWALKEYETLTPVSSAQQPISFRLAQVYVELHSMWLSPAELEAQRAAQKLAAKRSRREQPDTLDEGEHERLRRPIPALLHLPGVSRLAVKGGPGSGKSTALRRLLLEHLQSQGQEILPLYLELKELGAWLKRHPDIGQAPEHFLDWVCDQLGARGLTRAGLEARAGHGRILWLLDGLDEVVPDSLRLQAAKLIGCYFRHPSGTPDQVLLTGRPHAFDDAQIRHALDIDQHLAELELLTDDERSEYLQKWFREVYPHSPEKAYEQAQALNAAIPQHEQVDALSRTPLLLSTIAVVFFNGRRLPERRVDLYHEAVDLMLARRFVGHTRPGEYTLRSVRRALSVVAQAMMLQGKVRSLTRLDFERTLEQSFHPQGTSEAERVQLDALIEWLGAQSGLLSLRGDPARYTFSHLSVQEFLCAEWYASQRNPLEALGEKLDDPFWREVVLLTGGRLLMDGLAQAGEQYLEALLGHTQEASTRAWRSALLARILREAPTDALHRGFADQVKPRFVEVMSSTESPSTWKERVEVGFALGKLGDPRLGMDNPDRWVWHLPGSFMMGSESGDSAERPIHRVHIRQGFWLGKYPVTVQEYAAFVEANGYQTRAWWSEAGWKYILNEKRLAPMLWDDAKYTVPNQPVVGVSWYEAEAFCSWQSHRWVEAPPTRLLEGPMPVGPGAPVLRLPSESEWEYAARGEQSHTYPWGDTPEPGPELANFDGNAGRPTPVGAYPQGQSWAGAADLAGNVGEWCQDTWHDRYTGAPEDGSAWTSGRDSACRVIRGGSWTIFADWVCGANRDWDQAGDGDLDQGFRVVLVSVPGGVHRHSML